MPKWKPITFEDCPVCGDGIECLSEYDEKDIIGDNEQVRCIDDDCEFTGWTVVSEDECFINSED